MRRKRSNTRLAELYVHLRDARSWATSLEAVVKHQDHEIARLRSQMTPEQATEYDLTFYPSETGHGARHEH
jgi:hypothetical protein